MFKLKFIYNIIFLKKFKQQIINSNHLKKKNQYINTIKEQNKMLKSGQYGILRKHVC